jgi:hypothetical protein
MENDWIDDYVRQIVRALAEQLGMCPERFIRRLVLRELLAKPDGISTLPRLGIIDRHGMRGLNGQPVIPP